MSTTTYVYLGPYIECEYELFKSQRFHHSQCSNEKCPKYGREIRTHALYCGACGHPLIDVLEDFEVPSVDRWDVVDEVDEALSFINDEYIDHEPFDVWIPNVKRDEPRKFEFEPESNLQITPLDISASDERLWLTMAFHDEIEILRANYKRVEVLWGLIVYAM